MTYRDDLEAALARVKSLERELDEQRADDAEQAAKVAELKAQLAAAQEELARTEAFKRPPDAKRLPRQREVPRAKATFKGPVETPAPSGPRKGLSGAMKAILVGVGVVGVLSLALIRCADRGKATKKSDANWNRPPRTTERQVSLDDLIRQASVRAARALPDGKLARLSVRQIDKAGMVHLDYGSASFEFETPGATPCSVHLVIGWQGWEQRPGGACHETTRAPTCPPRTVLDAAWEGKMSETATVEYDGTTWSVWFRDGGSAAPVVVPDGCNPE